MGNKVIVTGGAGVIGQAICRRLLVGGYVPVAADLKTAIDGFDADRDGLRGTIGTAMDVTDRESVMSSVSSVVADGETVAGLVNCAGILRDSFLGELDEANMELMFQVNIAGMARVTDVVAPLMTDGSAIVNVGSLTGHFSRFRGASVYGATKAGIAAYTRYLAEELAPRGIRVNNVAPGTLGGVNGLFGLDPISAFGVFSRPSMMSSWTFNLPEATQDCRSLNASSR